jgi:hypothetical protein
MPTTRTCLKLSLTNLQPWRLPSTITPSTIAVLFDTHDILLSLRCICCFLLQPDGLSPPGGRPLNSFDHIFGGFDYESAYYR